MPKYDLMELGNIGLLKLGKQQESNGHIMEANGCYRIILETNSQDSLAKRSIFKLNSFPFPNIQIIICECFDAYFVYELFLFKY